MVQYSPVLTLIQQYSPFRLRREVVVELIIRYLKQLFSILHSVLNAQVR